MLKTCRICKENKDLKYFCRNRSKPDGYTTVCLACESKRQKKIRLEYNQSTANKEMLVMGSVKWL